VGFSSLFSFSVFLFSVFYFLFWIQFWVFFYFADVVYVNSIWMLCNDYYTHIPFETSILYCIILHTCVLFKIANKHEFISSFYFYVFLVDQSVWSIRVEEFYSKAFEDHYEVLVSYLRVLLTCILFYVITYSLKFCKLSSNSLSRLTLLLSLKMSKVDSVPIMAWSWLQR
jgi:hypothetical protein